MSSKQGGLSLGHRDDSNTKVQCLGFEFTNDKERREHFTTKLALALTDPEFRSQEGFPVATDEAILALSDPPYYTACPNPFLNDFAAQEDISQTDYSRPPFAADVTEGKSDKVYVAHSYHTKVPHRAIMRYILHYTNPNDVVLDLFCGTGMTGVAAQLCSSSSEVSSLGYRVHNDGSVSEKGESEWSRISTIGPRKAILLDLSPAATFIAYNQNKSTQAERLEPVALRVLEQLKAEHEWMYRTYHAPKNGELSKAIDALKFGKNVLEGSSGVINYAIWSQVFRCPSCAAEIVFWDVAVDAQNGLVRDEFPCPSCNLDLTKRSLDKAFETVYDASLNTQITRIKTVLARINYSVGKRRFEKRPDSYDIALAQYCDSIVCQSPHPTERLIDGIETRRNDSSGVTHVHQFYTRRNLIVFARAMELLPSELHWAVTGSLQRGSKQHQIAITRIGGEKAGVGGATAGHRRGTLYIPSNQVEMNPIQLLSDRIRSVQSGSIKSNSNSFAISTQSATKTNLKDASVDYIFVDPPFGANIAYSELNSIMESWIGIRTQQAPEAIQDRHQKKSIDDYREIMSSCFLEAFRVLKPGRWMTVEFSNTQASVWNAIQTALQSAGFVVANVAVLDKKRGGLNSITGITAVKQDLIISAYKPNGGLEGRFYERGGTEDTVWDFVQTHLKNLAVLRLKEGFMEAVPERDPRRIYDRMVAWFVRHNTAVPLSSAEFQQGILQRFPMRNGMAFLPKQVDEYDKKRLSTGVEPQMDLFVDDERSAIDWLADFLRAKPSTYQEVSPDFTQKIGAGWRKHEARPELAKLLDDNFLQYDGRGPLPPQIHSYLSSNWRELRNLEKTDQSLLEKARGRWYVPDPAKQQDVESRREKALLKEFEHYRMHQGRKLKEVRLEVLRAGFKSAWLAKDYRTILDVAGKITEEIWQEDEKLLTLYDLAETRLRSI